MTEQVKTISQTSHARHARVQAKPRRDPAPAAALTRCVVVGAGGYAGAELVSLLLEHPHLHIAGLFNSGKNAAAGGAAPTFADLFPRWNGRTNLVVAAAEGGAIAALQPEVVFLATPHEASHELAPALVESGAVVIDLSAAFRFKDGAVFSQHYGFAHKHAELLAQAVYGLPEFNREVLREANLIAAPGCYPTSAILALHSLVKAGAIAADWTPIIDSTSGVSGAGRAPALKSMFCEVSLQPYGVFSHRHAPEIAAHAGVPVIFTPHLGKFERGILSTIHVRLAQGWNAERVRDLYEGSYARELFVRLLPAGVWPSVAAVERTNFCDLGWAVDESRHHLIVVSAIDNLLKGAAGQAVQCMNIRFGWPESAGLPHARRKEATAT